MASLRGRTLFITGSSRGIGLAIALRAAREGANIAVVAKTTQPHPRLPGTIHTAVEAIEAAGGRGLALATDVRDEAAIAAAVDRTVEHFGGIDILVNNASAIHLATTEATPVGRLDLMHQVNQRATLLCSRACIPHLAASGHAHILTLSPPLDLDPRWFAPHLAYTISKYGMSLVVLGLAAELAPRGIAVNALWPRTVIDTAALRAMGGLIPPTACRRPEIVADAAYTILTRDPASCSGNFFLDEDVLRAAGVEEFSGYAVDPDVELAPDLFVGDPAGHLARLASALREPRP